MTTQELAAIVDKYAKQTGIDRELILKVIAAETGGQLDPIRAVSPVGAQGLMQLMPATAQEYGVEDPFNPDQNVRGGTEHLASLIKLYNGDIRKALAAHNWGQGNLAKGGPWPQETVNFVNKVAGPESSPTPEPFDPSKVDPTPAPIATPIPRQGPTYEQVTGDPNFGKYSPEDQTDILTRLVGPEAAMKHSQATGPMIGPAATPMKPDLPSIADAGQRVLAWLGLNKSGEALPTGPGSINTDKYPIEETLAERPLSEGDVAQTGQGLLNTALTAMAPFGATGLATSSVSTPLAIKNLLATLGLGSIGAGGLSLAGGAVGEATGYPELGKLGGEVLGMVGGGALGNVVAPHPPMPDVPGLSGDLASRVMDAIMSKRMKITAPRPDWAGYGEVPPEVLDAIKAKAAERTDIINRGPVRGVVTPDTGIPEVPPAAQRLVKTPQEAAVEGKIMELVQPQAPTGPVVPATAVGGTPVPPTGGAPVMPADQTEAQNVIEMIRSHLAQANNAAPPPVAQTPEQEALAAERMKLVDRGPVRGVVPVEGAPQETTMTPAVPVSQPTRGQVLPVPETPQEPRTVVTPQEAAARPTTLNLAPSEPPAVTPGVGTGPGRPETPGQPLTLPGDEAQSKEFLQMLQRSIAAARNQDMAAEAASTTPLPEKVAPESLAVSSVTPTETLSSSAAKTAPETLAASSATATPETSSTVRIGDRDYKVGDLIEEGAHKGKYVQTIENGQLASTSKAPPKVVDTAAVPAQNEIGAPQPQEIHTDLSLADGVPAELSMEARAVIEQLPKAEQEIIHKELERARSTDVLTGLQNKKGWIALAKTLGPEDHAVVMDMSGFSTLNNTHGHKVGDVVLAIVGQKVLKHLGSDTSRFGGDEFGGVIRGKSLEEAQQMVAALEADLNSTYINIRMPDGSIKRIKPLEAHIGLAKDTEAADLASNDHRAKYGSGRRKTDPDPTPGPADSSSLPSTVEGTGGSIERGGSGDKGKLSPKGEADSGIAKSEVKKKPAVGVVNPLDGVIEKTWTQDQVSRGNGVHSEYMGRPLAERVNASEGVAYAEDNGINNNDPLIRFQVKEGKVTIPIFDTPGYGDGPKPELIKPLSVEQFRSKIEDQLGLSSTGIAKARVSPGKAVGVTQPRLIRELGANLYSGDLGQVIVKEGLQNSVDAIPKGKAGNIIVKVNTKDKSFEIIDDGIGMMPDVIENEYLDPGGSYKPEGGRGGYGIAKVALLSNSDKIEVRSVAKVPKTGTKAEDSLSFSQWLQKWAEKAITEDDNPDDNPDLEQQAIGTVFDSLLDEDWSSTPSLEEFNNGLTRAFKDLSFAFADIEELRPEIINLFKAKVASQDKIAANPYVHMEGSKLETTLSGDSERWLDRENPMDVETREVPADTPTGTRVFFKLNPGASVSDYSVREYLQNFMTKQKLNHKFDITLDDKPLGPKQVYNREKGTYEELAKTTMMHTTQLPGAEVQVWTGKSMHETDYVSVHVLNDGLPQFYTHLNLRGRAKFPSEVEVNIIPKVETTDPNYPFTPNRQQLRDTVKDYVENFVTNRLYSEGVRQEQELYKQALKNKVPVPYTKVSVLEVTGRVKPETLKEIAESGEIQRVALLTAQIIRRAAATIVKSPISLGKGEERLKFAPSTFSTDLGYSGGKWYGVNVDTGRVYGKISEDTGELTRTGLKQFSIMVDPWSIVTLVDKNLPIDEQAEIFGRETWATAVHELMHNRHREHNEDFSSWLTHWLPHTIKEGSALIRSFKKEVQDDPEFFTKLREQQFRLESEFANAKGEDVLGPVTVQSKGGDGQHREGGVGGGPRGGLPEGSPGGGAGRVKGEGKLSTTEATGTDSGKKVDHPTGLSGIAKSEVEPKGKVLKPGVTLKPNEVFKRLLEKFTAPELKNYFGTFTGDVKTDEGQFEKIDAKIHKIFSDEEQTAWQEFLSFPENFSEKGDENLDLYKLFVKYLKKNPASTLRLKTPGGGATPTPKALADNEYYHGGSYKDGPIKGVVYLTKDPEFAKSYVSMAEDRGLEKPSLNRVKMDLKSAAPINLVKQTAKDLGIDTNYTPASMFDRELHGDEPVQKLIAVLQKKGYDHANLVDIPYGTGKKEQEVTVAFPIISKPPTSGPAKSR